jgi:hypothetical protein
MPFSASFWRSYVEGPENSFKNPAVITDNGGDDIWLQQPFSGEIVVKI